MKFVDRSSELDELKRVLESGRPALIRVYGRRRLGKTELLRRLCREQRGMYLLIDETDPPRQRESLSEQIAAETRTVPTPFLTWDAFYERLRNMDFRLIVLDEFQRLLSSDPQAVSRLQHHWDAAMRESGPSLVLCGSSIGMMQSVTARRTAPLFGRLAADMHLRPFTYAASRLLYPDASEEERVVRYAVFGGTPYYHEFSTGRTLKDAVTGAFLSPTAPLVEEPQNLLRLELKSPAKYNSILYEIGRGTHDLRGLESKVGTKRGGLGPYIEILRKDLGLIRMEDPVCGIGKQARYIFDDPFFGFYYRFVFENRSRLEMGRSEAVWQDINGALGEYVGREFERVAREALTCLNGTSWKGVRIDFDEIGRWWNRPGEEIDVVAAGKSEVIAGEVKWSASPMRLDVFSRLQGKVRLIERLDGLPVRCLLVSRGGFDAELRKEAERRAALLFDLRDLEEIFNKSHGKPK